MRDCLAVLLLTLAAVGCAAAPPAARHESPYGAWSRGPSADANYFPIAVWCQDPKNAAAFQALGINTYVALWNGPTEAQLAALRKAGMRVFCDQNAVGLKHLDDPTIVGWMHGDEPDNCQSDGKGGWGAPIPPAKIVAEYTQIRRNDPTRPVMLNLGQGVAYDEYVGTWAPLSDYPEYMKGADVVSFDIYPMAASKGMAGLDWLWAVGKGVSRLSHWSSGRQVVWNALECTTIDEPGHKATPEQVKSEVWMSIIHGSRGIIYFVHQFKPTFIEAGLLADAEMSAAVKAIDEQIQALARVLNAPSIENGGTATPSDPLAPVDIMVKEQGDARYLFAVGMRNRPTKATLTFDRLHRAKANATVTVVGEGRSLQAWGGRFEDAFSPYQVHIYRVSLK